MRLGHFDEVQEHRKWQAFFFEVDSDRDVGFVVRGGPCVSGKAELAVVLLVRTS